MHHCSIASGMERAKAEAAGSSSTASASAYGSTEPEEGEIEMILNKLPEDLLEYVKSLANDKSFQYYFAHDPVLNAFDEQRKKFDEKIDVLIDFMKKDCDLSEKHTELEILEKMKEDNASSFGKNMDERASNIIVEYMVLHGKIKAEDFDKTLKLMLTSEEEKE